jgi:hypothetical protein
MDSTTAPDAIQRLVKTVKHYPNNTVSMVDSGEVEAAIDRWTTNRDEVAFIEIIDRCRPMFLALISSSRAGRYLEPRDLMSRIHVKLWKYVHGYDRAKAPAFTYISRIAWTAIISAIVESRRDSDRYVSTDAEIEEFSVPAESFALEEVYHHFRQVRTVCPEDEWPAQRWIIQSLIEWAPTILPRHIGAEACTRVFDISRVRARRVFDLTVLGVRQVLATDLAARNLDPAKLRTTKARPLLRYAEHLSRDDFSRLVVMLRGLAPTTIIAIEPANEPAIRAGNIDATRVNIGYVLRGHPAAQPLF